MKKRAPAFHEWVQSNANPLADASEAARYFTAEALRAAFEAGEAHERTKNADLEENVFT